MAIRYERVTIADGEVELSLDEVLFGVRHVPAEQFGGANDGKFPVGQLKALKHVVEEAIAFRANRGASAQHTPRPGKKWRLEYVPDSRFDCCDAGCTERATFYFEAGGIGSYHCAKLAQNLVRQPSDEVQP